MASMGIIFNVFLEIILKCFSNISLKKVIQVEPSVVITSKNPFVIFEEQFVENSSWTC